MRLLFVCTGNICRSPFAEAVARRERPDIEVASAGTAALAGAACPPEAIAAAGELGVDLRRHRARPLEADDVGRADALVAMDAHHLQAICAAGGASKARLLADVPILDPFGGGIDEYRRRYREIARAVKELLARLEAPPARRSAGPAAPPSPHTPPWVGKRIHPPPEASVSPKP